jgi:hypothetical protein
MSHCKKNIALLFRFLLLLLFIGYYSCITLFFHAHLINGVVIVHSHPFRKNPDSGPFQSHSHPPSAYLLIHQLNKPLLENSAETHVFSDQAVLLNVYLSSYTCTFFPSVAHSDAKLRAPPVA